MRALYAAFGWLSVTLGVVGMMLPLVPTVPFLLLAAGLFAKSSPRFHQWLVDHPRLGPPIVNWRQHRAIGRRAKRLAMLSIAASFAISVALGVAGWVLAVQAATLGAVSVFILTRPSGEARR